MALKELFQLSATVLGSLGGGAAIVFGFSNWLGKVWATRILETERAELQRMREEHNVRFSTLHDKRVTIIAELFEKFREVDYGVRQVQYWIEQSKPDKKWIAKASLKLGSSYVDARQYFEKHQIYFSNSLCKELHDILESSSAISDEYFIRLIDKEGADLNDAITWARDYVKEKKKSVDSGLQSIENEFRNILGVN